MRDEVWDAIAKARGYETMKFLIMTLYAPKDPTKTPPMSKKQIADFVGCSPGAITRCMLQYGIKEREVHRPRPPIPSKDLRELSITELSARFGISRTMAWKMKKEVIAKDKATKEKRAATRALGKSVPPAELPSALTDVDVR